MAFPFTSTGPSLACSSSNSFGSPHSYDRGPSNSSRKRARPSGSSSQALHKTGPTLALNSPFLIVDTPAETTTRIYESLDRDSEGESWKRWSSSRNLAGDHPPYAGAQQPVVTGGKRGRTASDQTYAHETSWGQYVFTVVGGIAGKMLDFCTAGAFKGFVAGGGPGYAMTDAAPRLVEHYRSPWEESCYEDRSHEQTVAASRMDTFEDDYEDEYQRPAKRQHIRSNDGWVMIEPRPQDAPRKSSSHQHFSSPVRVASRATIRPSSVWWPKTSNGRLASTSYAGSPQSSNSHKRAASFATGRSPGTSPSQYHQSTSEQQTSPLRARVDVDLQKYSAKRHREVKQSDASMRRLNDQLQAMIRQGQQALHSKVEVLDQSTGDDDLDEGYAEGYDVDGYRYR